MKLVDNHGTLAANGALNSEYKAHFQRLLGLLRTSKSQTGRAVILASPASSQLCQVLEKLYNELSQ